MASSSDGADWTIQSLLDAMSARRAAPAVIAFEAERAVETSYAELAERVQRLACGMRDAGLGSDSAIGLYAPNSAAWVTVRLAAAAAGIVSVALDELMEEAEAAEILVESGCRWLFTTRAHAQSLSTLAPACQIEMILLDDGTGDGADRSARFRDWRDIAAERPAALPPLDAGAPTALVFTSGTTGAPKGFPLTHNNIAVNVDALIGERLVRADDRVLLPLPLHHVYPLVVGMLTVLAAGAALVLPESVTGPRILHALRAGRVTAIVGVPRLYTALLANLDSRARGAGRLVAAYYRTAHALTAALQRVAGIRAGRWLFWPLRRKVAPTLRLLACGGAHLDAASAHALQRLGWRVFTGYGLAETASIFTANLPGRQRIGSEGRALAGGEIRISMPGADSIGEIELRGANVTAGYRNNEAANAAAFTADGWFRTGDLGRLDDDGYLYVTGRSKELIVLGGGKNVFPEDVEKIYDAPDVVDELAVLEKDGRLVALVRPDVRAIHDAGLLSVEDSIRVALAEAGQKLPPYERIAGYALTSQALPRTRLGKYRRFLLPDLYERAARGAVAGEAEPLTQADRTLLAAPVAHAIWQWLTARYPDRPMSPATSLQLDLGIDSLEWLNLSLDIAARFGVEFDEADIADMVTVRDLLQRAANRSDQRRAVQHIPITGDPLTYAAPPGFLQGALGALAYGVVWSVMRSVFRLSVHGGNHVPESGPAVIVANHASYLDALVIAASLSAKRARHMYWGGAVNILFQSRLSRLFCRVAHVFPIDERTPRTTLDIGRAILGRGDALVWFPEAWRTPTGELQPFRTGIGTLLTQNPVPVVPAHIEGTFDALPRSRKWPRLNRLAVAFGPAVDVATLAREGGGASDEVRVANALHDRVAALAEPE